MKKGFTIVEIMVALIVLSIGIVGIYSLVPKVILNTSINSNRFLASQLAREGMEIVRNIRDSNWIEGAEWNSGLISCAGGCEIDYNDTTLVSYQSRYLRISQFFNYESGQNTKFKRKITITPEENILTVLVEVTWAGKYSPLTVSEKLYNWR